MEQDSSSKSAGSRRNKTRPVLTLQIPITGRSKSQDQLDSLGTDENNNTHCDKLELAQLNSTSRSNSSLWKSIADEHEANTVDKYNNNNNRQELKTQEQQFGQFLDLRKGSVLSRSEISLRIELCDSDNELDKHVAGSSEYEEGNNYGLGHRRDVIRGSKRRSLASRDSSSRCICKSRSNSDLLRQQVREGRLASSLSGSASSLFDASLATSCDVLIAPGSAPIGGTPSGALGVSVSVARAQAGPRAPESAGYLGECPASAPVLLRPEPFFCKHQASLVGSRTSSVANMSQLDLDLESVISKTSQCNLIECLREDTSNKFELELKLERQRQMELLKQELKAEQLKRKRESKASKLSSSSSSSSLASLKDKAQVESDETRDVDCGYAFVILAVMFIINASTFGSARAYGLIFKRMAREEQQSRSAAAMPFTVMGAVENMSGPLIGYLLTQRNCSWRSIIFVGTALICLAHVISGLVAEYKEWSLLGQTLSMGFMCGFGMSCITISSFQINHAYFVRYRSRAFGLGLTGAVFGALYMTPACQYMLVTHQSVKYCYLVLGLFLLPSVPLSLLLRPKALPRATVEAELVHQEMPPTQELAIDEDDKQILASLDLSKRDSKILTLQTIRGQQLMKIAELEEKPGALDAKFVEITDEQLGCESQRQSQSQSRAQTESESEPEPEPEPELARAKQETSANSRAYYSIERQKIAESNKKQEDLIASLEKQEPEPSTQGTWNTISRIVGEPIFHLIWPTQLLFCWFNFTFGLIIADFGRDRQLDEDNSSNLLLIWAMGQLFGRTLLGAIVDMNYISYKSFTIVCLSVIGTCTWLLSHVELLVSPIATTAAQMAPTDIGVTALDLISGETAQQGAGIALYASTETTLCISLIVFVMSMFVANLYILLNGLVLRYMSTQLAAMSLGLSSFLGSFLLLPRAHTIGFFHKQFDSYDEMLTLFAYIAFFAALSWLVIPKFVTVSRRQAKATALAKARVRLSIASLALAKTTNLDDSRKHTKEAISRARAKAKEAEAETAAAKALAG